MVDDPFFDLFPKGVAYPLPETDLDAIGHILLPLSPIRQFSGAIRSYQMPMEITTERKAR